MMRRANSRPTSHRPGARQTKKPLGVQSMGPALYQQIRAAVRQLEQRSATAGER